MLFDPRVQVKAVEGDPFFADGNDDQPRANVAVEHAASDTAVGRGAWRVHERVKKQDYAALVVQGYGRDTHVLFHVKHVS